MIVYKVITEKELMADMPDGHWNPTAVGVRAEFKCYSGTAFLPVGTFNETGLYVKLKALALDELSNHIKRSIGDAVEKIEKYETDLEQYQEDLKELMSLTRDTMEDPNG